ncbi:MAG: RnfABCDGE type electron transport complex subunit D [Pseudomonadota bacterium]
MIREVCLALVPAAIVYTYFFGWGVVFNVAICISACVAFEALALTLKQQAPLPVLADYSACLTGLLLAFALPTYLPIYVTLTACAFAILVAKQAYGGIGFNLFNPAMVGYCAVMVSFPIEMSTWLPPFLGDIDYVRPAFTDQLLYVLTGDWPAPYTLDAVSQATPLDRVKSGLHASEIFIEIRTNPVFGDFGGRGWEWIGNFIALGGGYLLYRGLISWHIPVSVLAGVVIPATLHSLLVSGAVPGAGFHVFSGATLLGAFFIATDPVSAASHPRGRLVYGFGIGLIAWSIRTWGGYPDGIAFAVLLMNTAVPLIDRFSKPEGTAHAA